MTDTPANGDRASDAVRAVSPELIELAARAQKAAAKLDGFMPSGYFVMYHRYSPRPMQSGLESKQAARLYLEQFGKRIGMKPRIDYTSGLPLIFCDSEKKRDSLDRPALLDAIAHAHPGDLILVDNPDRIAVSDIAFAAFETTAHEHGCRFEFADGTPPATDELREVIMAVKNFTKKTTLKDIRRRQSAKFRDLRAVGLWPAFTPKPFGYDKIVIGQDSAGKNLYTIVQNDDEQAVLLYMMMLYQSGLGYCAIARRLNAEGIESSRGGKWHDPSVKLVLEREFDRYGIPASRNAEEMEDQREALRRLGIAKPGKKVVPWSKREASIKSYRKPEYTNPPLSKETANHAGTGQAEDRGEEEG